MRALKLSQLFLLALISLVRGEVADDDTYVTNEDNNLYVPISPPIKITFYGTPAVLSTDGLQALVKAASDFATMRMRVYFNKYTTPTPYMFDQVMFEAIDVKPRVFGEARKLRVFEAAETEMGLQYAEDTEEWASRISGPNKWNIELSRAQPYESDERQLQQTIYGQSVTLFGNMTFSLAPSAPAQLCNDQLLLEMNRLWGLRSQLIATNHPDLVNLKDYGMVTEIGTMPPSPSPTKSPTESPTVPPTHFPSLSPTTGRPTVSFRPTVSAQPSLRPSVARNQTTNRSSVSNQYVTNIIVPVACAAALIGVGLLFFAKKRGKEVKTKTLSENDLDDADEEIGARLLGFGSPTKDDDASEEESTSGSDIVDADASRASPATQPRTISSNQTMKASNVGKSNESIEQAWTTLVSPSSIKGRKNASLSADSDQTNIKFPVVLENGDTDDDDYDEQSDPDSDENSITSETPLNTTPEKLDTSTISATLATVNVDPSASTPENKKVGSPTINSTLGRYTPTRRAISPPNQVTKVTPSKVSKEEFEQQDWGVDIPFHWTPGKSKMKFLNSGKKSAPKIDDPDIEISGSFPTFDEAEEPPIPPPGSAGQNLESTVGDSSAFSNSLHPGDWSNNGGATDEEDITNDPDTAASGLRYNMSPGLDASFHSKKSPHSVDSSPSSSKGSSKQLIHDLVWLEKKIADVRSRVDRLDGDESQVATSPPMSPNSMGSNSAGSPISTNIICRDVVAPPGKLHIVIHSTKDGPAIHSVKQGSVLENKIFAGDLILAVNDHDTRNCTAEAVMEIMSKNSSSQRKLTVIHASL